MLSVGSRFSSKLGENLQPPLPRTPIVNDYDPTKLFPDERQQPDRNLLLVRSSEGLRQFSWLVHFRVWVRYGSEIT